LIESGIDVANLSSVENESLDKQDEKLGVFSLCRPNLSRFAEIRVGSSSQD